MRIALASLLLITAAACSPEQQTADIAIVNARIFTADPAAPWAEAVAIKDGKFLAVGASTDIAAIKATRSIDAGGKLVVPGLTDAHVHLGSSGDACQRLPPRALPFPGPTADELLADVKAAAASGDGWICGTSGPIISEDPRSWRAALDAASPTRPVIVSSSWGHPSFVNSAAFAAMGVADTTPDPAGGRFERDASGKLTGRIAESAETLAYLAVTKDVAPASITPAAAEIARRYLEWGVTEAHLMATGAELSKNLAALAGAQTPLRWTIYGWAYPASPLTKIWDDVEAATPPANVHFAGTKWILDGTPIERGAFQTVAYADKPDWFGVSNYSDADLDVIVTNALSRSGQTALHVVGDAELTRLLSLMEAKASAEQWAAKRVRLEHADGLSPALIARAVKLGVVIVQNPLHLDPAPMGASAEHPAGTRYTPEALARSFPLKSLVAAHAPLALGSDASGDGLNPWLNIMLATLHPLNPQEALTREQALAAYTSGGAYAAGEEAERGMIRTGMTADLAVLSQDVLTVPPPQLPATRSLLTIAKGQVAHEDPTFAAP